MLVVAAVLGYIPAQAQFGPQQLLAGGAIGANSVYATDLDGDGDADVLSASWGHSKIAWYENLGSGSFGPQQVITTNAISARSVYATDLDGDGDADVLSAAPGVLDLACACYLGAEIAWYENLGSGAFGPQQVITTAAKGAWSVHATDLDEDGDADVLSASVYDDKIAWYENLGGGTFGPQQVITTAAIGARSVYATDLDGDGDADVLSASQTDNKIAWYENLGSGSFGPQQVITTNAIWARSVYATDLDGDGDADVLSASQSDDKIAWYENLGGGTFGPQQVITTAADFALSVYATDLDGDGDADVLSASQTDNKIAWYENLGSGAFGPQQVITTNAILAWSVYATDLDGDADADVLSASSGDHKIAWYANLFPVSAECFLIDFETEDDQETPLANGQDITTPPEFGELVSIEGSGANYGAAIFDSDPAGQNANGSDPDLLVDQGNLLILQQNPYQSMPGYFAVPNDSILGGTLAFDFLEPVEVRSIDLIDIDEPDQECWVTLMNPSGSSRTFYVPSGWTSDIVLDGGAGVGTLDLTSLDPQVGFASTAQGQDAGSFDPQDVVRMAVFLTSSGAVDNLMLCLPKDPARSSTGVPGVERYGCGVNPTGSISVVSGTPSLSSTLVVGVDNPIGSQSVGSVAFLAVSALADANFPCGTVLPGLGMSAPYSGEVLIDFTLFFSLPGPAWDGAGSATPISIVFPSSASLRGLELYAQGGLIDTTPGAVRTVGLTEALKLTLGSY